MQKMTITARCEIRTLSANQIEQWYR